MLYFLDHNCISVFVHLFSQTQFIEIKGSVFKKFGKNNLFQMSNSGKILHVIPELIHLIHHFKYFKEQENQKHWYVLIQLASYVTLSVCTIFTLAQLMKHWNIERICPTKTHYLYCSSELLLQQTSQRLFDSKTKISVFLWYPFKSNEKQQLVN